MRGEGEGEGEALAGTHRLRHHRRPEVRLLSGLLRLRRLYYTTITATYYCLLPPTTTDLYCLLLLPTTAYYYYLLLLPTTYYGPRPPWQCSASEEEGEPMGPMATHLLWVSYG